MASNPGYQQVSAAALKKQAATEKDALKGVTTEPAACKSLAVKDAESAPSDVAAVSRLLTVGAVGVTFYSGAAEWSGSNRDAATSMAAKCGTVKQKSGGQEMTTEYKLWDIAGVSADNVFGSTVIYKATSGALYQTQAFASLGDRAVQVRLVSDRGGASEQAAAKKVLQDALASLAG